MAELSPPNKPIPPRLTFGLGCLRRLSLRWLLLFVAAVGLWLGYLKQVVDERTAVREWLATHGQVGDHEPTFEALARQEGRNPTGVSWCLRQVMGDSPLYGIGLNDPTVEEMERVHRAFPEAILLPVFSTYPPPN